MLLGVYQPYLQDMKANSCHLDSLKSLTSAGYVLSSRSREIPHLWSCLGEYGHYETCQCMCACRQILACPNKHTQTNISLVEAFDSPCGRVFISLFTISGCHVVSHCYLVFVAHLWLVMQLFSYSDLLSRHCLQLLLRETQTWNWTGLLPKTFLCGGTTISTTPPTPCPCAALKGLPSWCLSSWWGLSVYYWALSSPNSLSRVPPPNFSASSSWTHKHAGAVSCENRNLASHINMHLWSVDEKHLEI